MVSPLVKQYWVVLGVVSNLVGQGFVLSYPASLQDGLRSPDSDIRTTPEIITWLGSCVGISQIFGFLMSSVIMDVYGRRVAQMMAIVPGLLGWLLIYFASNVLTLFVGRILCGVMSGASVSLGAMIIGEYTSPENRGLFLNFKTAATNLGVTLLHIAAFNFNWRQVALFALIPISVAFLNIYTWRESPAWLITKKRYDESERDFYYIRGRTEETITEFQELLERQKLLMANQKPEGCMTIMKKFTERDFIKPVLIIFFGFAILEACGRHTFPAYAKDIIQRITGNSEQTVVMTLSIDVITTASAAFSCVLVKVMRRRALLLWSGAAALVVLGATASLLLLRSRGMLPTALAGGAPPLALLALYFVVANLGCTPIPLALLGEVFPLRHRGAGATVGGIAMSISLVIFLKLTPTMLSSIDVYGTFAVNASIMAVSLTYLYFALPETKNRTLQEIEDFFNNGQFNDEKQDKDEGEVMLKETTKSDV